MNACVQLANRRLPEWEHVIHMRDLLGKQALAWCALQKHKPCHEQGNRSD